MKHCLPKRLNKYTNVAMQLQSKNLKRFYRFCNCFDVFKAGANRLLGVVLHI
jgi:hypothetical protein